MENVQDEDTQDVGSFDGDETCVEVEVDKNAADSNHADSERAVVDNNDDNSRPFLVDWRLWQSEYDMLQGRISMLIQMDDELQTSVLQFRQKAWRARYYGEPFLYEPVGIGDIKFADLLDPGLPEELAAMRSYMATHRDHRRFYLNLLIRPSWQKKREELRTAYIGGLIYYGAPLHQSKAKLTVLDPATDHDPEFQINADIIGRTGCLTMTRAEAEDKYKKMNLMVAQVPDILDVAEVGFRTAPKILHYLAWPDNFLPISSFRQGPINPFYCFLHKHPRFSGFIDTVYSILRAQFIRCANDINIDTVSYRGKLERLGVHRQEVNRVYDLYKRHVYKPAWLFWHHNADVSNPTTTYLYEMDGRTLVLEDLPMRDEKYPWILHVQCKGLSSRPHHSDYS